MTARGRRQRSPRSCYVVVLKGPCEGAKPVEDLPQNGEGSPMRTGSVFPNMTHILSLQLSKGTRRMDGAAQASTNLGPQGTSWKI